MAKGNFTDCLNVTLAYEGGFVNHPKDPGGATNMGITAATLSIWRGFKPTSIDDVRNLTKAEAAEIYEARYWNKVKGDLLPAGLDLATFDYGVHSGIAQASKDLQRVVGVEVDGRIGPLTLAAVKGYSAMTDVIKGLCARRGGLLRGLASWEVFKRGWSSRLAHVEATAVSMWLKAAGVGAGEQTSVLQEEAERAGDKSVKQNRTAGQSMGGGAVVGTGGTAADLGGVAADGTIWWVIALVLAALAVGAVLLYKAKQNRERAGAYTLAAWVH